MTNAAGETSRPIAGSTFIVCSPFLSPLLDTPAAPKFFGWGYQNGKQVPTDLGYAPMPDSVVDLIEKRWTDQIKSADDKPVFWR